MDSGPSGLRANAIYRVRGKVSLYATDWGVYPTSRNGLPCLAIGLRTQVLEEIQGQFVGEIVGKLLTKPRVSTAAPSASELSYVAAAESDGYWFSPGVCPKTDYFLAVDRLPSR